MVQAFLPHAPEKPLANGIGSWRLNRRCEQLDATGRRHSAETGSKLTIMITDQILWRLSIGGGLAELLGHPRIGRRACHAHMDHLARPQFDKEEGKKRPKEQIGDLQEVTGPDLIGVRAQKDRLLLTSWLVRANSSGILLDGALTHMHPQFQEFIANPLGTPKPILSGHLPDQGNGFLGYFGLVRCGLGLTFPIQAKELPMPAQQGLWLHDVEGLMPSPNQPGQQDEEHAIGSGDGWQFHLSPEDDELLAQEGIFGH